MTKREITLTFEDEKLEALEYALRKERTAVQKQMDEALRQFYETKVPEAVRDYLDNKGKPAAPRRPPRQGKSNVLPGAQERDRKTSVDAGCGESETGTFCASGTAPRGTPNSSDARGG